MGAADATTLAAPPGSRRGYLDTSAGQIHYREAGPPDGQPLVLVHQNPCSSLMFARLLPHLSRRGYRALAPDLPGYGNSDAPAAGGTLSAYMRALLDFLAGCQLTKADFFGHHSGGALAAALAAEYPVRVRRLVLWGPPLLTPEEAERLARTDPLDYAQLWPSLEAQWAYRRAQAGESFTAQVGARYLLEWLQAGPAWQRLYRVVASLDLGAYLRQVEQPTLVLASRQDRLWEASHRVTRLLRRGRFIEVTGVSADVADERPAELATVIDTFLRADPEEEQA